MMHLPHLSFLRSFEAAARHGSFTAAAEELNCTQSAVSNHVRSLESFIGRPLFVRHPRSLSLTDVGEAYLPTVRQALRDIDLATQSLIMQTYKREVVVSCPFSLAENWLPEVVRGFHAQHPEIDLTLHGTVWTDVDEKVSDISIAINHEDDMVPGLTRLWAEELGVFCAPHYRVDGCALTSPEQLHAVEQIHILGRLDYWPQVFKGLGLADADLRASVRASATNLALELAVSGLGCVVAPRSLAQRFVERGLLVAPFPVSVTSPWIYWVRVNEQSPSVMLFLEWLLAAAGEHDAATTG